jgi:predicted nucleic-acid-binding protein
MKIIDANIILRYILNDSPVMSQSAKEIITMGEVFVPTEVLAEVVYVLMGVYSIPRTKISDILSEFIDEVKTTDSTAIKEGLHTFSETTLDFVDCLLLAYHTVSGYEVLTFDKKLNKLLRARN